MQVAAGTVLLLALMGAVVWRVYRGDGVIPVAAVTSVEQRDIGHVASFSVRTPDGRDLRFGADPDLNQSPGHVREHMAFAEPVRIHYRRSGTTLVAMAVADAESHP